MELEGKLHGWGPGVGALDGAGLQVPPLHGTALLPIGAHEGVTRTGSRPGCWTRTRSQAPRFPDGT